MRAACFAVAMLLAGPLSAEEKPGCPAGQYTVIRWPPLARKMYVPWESVKPRGQGGCKPCPKGAVTVKDNDGWNYCVGGPALPGQPGSACPPGSGLVGPEDPFRPVVCVPCPGGRVSLAVNGMPVCVPDACPQGKLPIEKLGPVRKLECAAPLEDEVDWETVLSRTGPNKLAVPACPSSQGLTWDERGGSYRCERCGAGKHVVKRFSQPVCGNPTKLSCRQGETLVLDRLQQPVACGKAPAVNP